MSLQKGIFLFVFILVALCEITGGLLVSMTIYSATLRNLHFVISFTYYEFSGYVALNRAIEIYVS